MAAQVVPFAPTDRRRVRFVAAPTQRHTLEQFMSNLQLLMLEHPNAFKLVAAKVHHLACPIRRKLTRRA